MEISKYKGFVFGLISSATFGLIPLFVVPVLNGGMDIYSVLFYRYTFSAIFISLYVLIKRENMRLSFSDIPMLFLLIVLSGLTALFLISGYQYVSSGVATTIHFLYPVFVTLFMIIFFKEKSSIYVWLSIIIAMFGVAMLSTGGGEHKISLLGLGFVLLSVITYATYIVGINKSRISKISGLKVTFYVLVVLAVMFYVNGMLSGGIAPLGGIENGINLALLGLIPTLLSNLTLVLAIKYIGSTTTAVMGSMEPVTAVVVGVLVFQEPFSLGHLGGIVLVISSVVIIVLAKWMKGKSS